MMNVGVFSKFLVVSVLMVSFTYEVWAHQPVTCKAITRPRKNVKDPTKLRRWAEWKLDHAPFLYDGLAYKLIPPARPGNRTAIVIHGLGNSGKDMREQAITALMRGHGVFLPDQHGHGKTLEITQRQLKNPNDVKEILSKYKLRQNAIDIYNIAYKHKLKSLYIVSHSLGGNVAAWVGNEFAVHGTTKQMGLMGIVPMAPYSGRADTELERYIMSPELWTVDLAAEGLLKLGIDVETIQKFADPFYRWYGVLYTQPRFMEDIFYKALGVQKIKDGMQDPLKDAYLKAQFIDYFEAEIKKDLGVEVLTREQSARARLYAELSLGITKLNREESLLTQLEEFPKIDCPVILIATRKDMLSLFYQNVRLHQRFLVKGITTIFKVMPDPNLTHFFPQTHPELTQEVIDDAFRSLGIDLTQPKHVETAQDQAKPNQ